LIKLLKAENLAWRKDLARIQDYPRNLFENHVKWVGFAENQRGCFLLPRRIATYRQNKQ
jgi:hypothetical protein